MLSHEGLDNNICFLILEVRQQLQKTRSFLEAPSEELIDSILARDDYIDNLRSIIQRKCFAQVARLGDVDDPGVHLLKAFDVVSQNLERIADFCEDIVNQANHVEDKELLRAQDFDTCFDEVLAGVNRIDSALFDRNVQIALQICRNEDNLDRIYAQQLRSTIVELESHTNPHGLMTVVFIFHYFERMGDALLNIGEAVISACLGERIKISRFWALEDSLDDTRKANGSTPIQMTPMADTRSGSRISRIEHSSGERGRSVIFKEGRLHKLLEEKKNIERWNEVMPGLAPKIHSFHEHGDTGATLFEYLPGQTFEEILLLGRPAELQHALEEICKTLETLWRTTRTEEPSAARFTRQLTRRLEDVYSVHPEFRAPGHQIGNLAVKSFDSLLEQMGALDDTLVCPFSVFIHGDLNLDNVIFDVAQDRVRFIDLGRSAMMDYAQDVSVFLVSNYRLQALENPMRSRLRMVLGHFTRFARGFASRQGDPTFEARLGLGLARSFASSTRFVLAPEMAKEMFLRARYLLEHLVDHSESQGPAGFATFKIPTEVLLD